VSSRALDHDRFGDKLGHILTICQKLNTERNLSALLDLIVREATQLIEADRATLFLLDRDKHGLWSKVALGVDEMLRFDAHLGIAGAVATTGRPISAADARRDPHFYAAIDAVTGYETKSLLAMPLTNLHGETIGAFEVLNKHGGGPFTPEDEEILRALAAQAAIAIETAQMVEELKRHRDQLLEENTRLWTELEGKLPGQRLLGTSDKIQAISKLIEQIKDSVVDVLITGESGTGKEVVAKTIHYTSPRARRPFVALNCAALPETLVESELFGIEKGVATGVERRIGKFEAAHGGTIFLDEVGDLSLTAQAKLLRVLQERTVERVGGRKPIPVDVRVLSATNKDLEAAITNGTFRDDLYYRLKVIHIATPALREIPGDIPIIAHSLLAAYCREIKKEPPTLSPPALAKLTTYAWPGNVRELENEIKRLVAITRGNVIGEEDLSERIRRPQPDLAVTAPADHSLKSAVSELEKRIIRDTLELYRNQQQSARVLGMSRQGLIKKMRRYGIR
jgi:Nif-specific regulatory protein